MTKLKFALFLCLIILPFLVFAWNIPGHMVSGAIAGETGIAGNAIGSIDIYDKFTFVEVPKNDVQRVLKGMDNNSIKGKKVNIEIARQ